MRRWWLVLGAAVLSACGGGSSTSTSTPAAAATAVPTPATRAAVVLDRGSFDTRVASGAALVEFQRPT